MGGTVYDYYQKSYEAHERIACRRHQAQAERIIRRARTRRRRRRARLAGALGLLDGATRAAQRPRLSV
jgi:hypothetical protein